MTTRICAVCLAAALLFLGSCSVGPLVPVVKVDQDAAARLRNDLPTYRDTGEQYIVSVVGVMSATSCKNLLWDPPASRDDAIAQLRYKASAAGANAISAPACQAEGTSLDKNCWSSVTCTAQALKTASKSSLEAKIEQEFWRASPLTKGEYAEDSRELNSVSPQQWEALRNFDAGVETDEDRFQVKMLSKEQRRAIVEVAKWLTWKDRWVEQQQAQAQADRDQQREAAWQEQELAIRRFQALEAARPRFTDCFPNYLGGTSCVQR